MSHKLQDMHYGIRPISAYLRLIAAGLLAASCFICGCSSRRGSTTEPPKTGVAQSSTAVPVTTTAAPQPGPTLTEVNQALARVFKDAAIVDSKHQPNFFTGDFNGDASPDLAVIVMAAPGKLEDLNQQFPPWILKDPVAAAKPGAPPLRVVANEALLAIIHGYGANGWRDPQATQTYLLKNAVGPEAKFQPKAEFLAAGQGKTLPGVAGDLISESLQGKPGYLYYSGIQYSWYDPKTFTGESQARVVHGGMTKQNKIDLLHPKLIAAEK